MRFQDRRRSLRDLPPGPAAAPETPVTEPDPALVSGLRARLEDHPAHFHQLLYRPDRALLEEGAGGPLLAALHPLLQVDPGLFESPGVGEEEVALALPASGAFGGAPPRALCEVMEAVAETLGTRIEAGPACPAVEVLVRVRRELASCGHYWVCYGAQGLALPLAWASLCRGLARALQQAGGRYPDDLAARLGELEAEERRRLEENLALLAPGLHEAWVVGPVELGAGRLLDAWRIMLNGVDRRVFGGLREL